MVQQLLEQLRDFGKTFLRGRLTYIVAFIGLIGSLALYINGTIDTEILIFIVNTNLAILGIRRAIG